MKINYHRSRSKIVYWQIEGVPGYYRKRPTCPIENIRDRVPHFFNKTIEVCDTLGNNSAAVYEKIATALDPEKTRKEEAVLEGKGTATEIYKTVMELQKSVKNCISHDPESEHVKAWNKIHSLLSTENALTKWIRSKFGDYTVELEFRNEGQCILKGKQMIAVRHHNRWKTLEYYAKVYLPGV